jgi:hypothetical protein
MIIIFAGVYYYLQEKKVFQFLFIAMTIVLFLSSFNQTITKVKDNSKPLKMAMKGNILYGLTPDWQNYIELSKWAAKNVPATENIAVRKPGTSTIYANRNFYGVYKVPDISKDTLETWKPDSTKMIFVVNISSKTPNMIAEYLTFVASGATTIQGEKTNSTGLYEINTKDSLWVATFLNEGNTKFTLDYKGFKNDFMKSADNLLYYPEKLFNTLKQANVKYMILASIRTNANVNNGTIITTLHRYSALLRLKYPYLITEKFTIGQSEPATLLELKY